MLFPAGASHSTLVSRPQQALQQAGGNLEAAAELLLGGGGVVAEPPPPLAGGGGHTIKEMLAAQSEQHGLSGRDVDGMVAELQAVAGCMAGKAQAMLLASDFDLNRALEHHFAAEADSATPRSGASPGTPNQHISLGALNELES